MSVRSCSRRISATVVLVLFTFAVAAALGKPGGGKGGGGEVAKEIPVCIGFDDLDGDGVKSDGDLYCDGDANGKVTAFVGRNFSSVFNGNNSKKTNAGRTFFLDLGFGLGPDLSVHVDVNRPSPSGPVGDGICDPYVDGAPDLPAVRFGPLDGEKFGFPDNAKLEILGRDLDGLTPELGPFATNARLTFEVGSDTWVLHWGPFKNPGGGTYAPGSDPVEVTRLDNDTWTFETTGFHLACLYRIVKNSPPEYHGQFVVPFGAMAVAIEPESGIPEAIAGWRSAVRRLAHRLRWCTDS